MNKRNCPNCWAPYDIDVNKCPYCGTSYFDMSSLDFTYGEPFYLKFKINMGGKDVYITQLVKPRVDSIDISSESVMAYDKYGNNTANYITSKSMSTNICFESVCCMGNDTLCEIYRIEE